MWETRTPLPKALQRLLSTPAQRPTLHGTLSAVSHTGETSQQFDDVPNTKLHKRRTLQTGTPHWKTKEATHSRNIFIAIDPHPSVTQLLPSDQRAIVESFFSQWGTRQRLKIKFLKAIPHDGWSEGLTKQWQQELHNFRDGKLLILSDFHGPHFFSDSLRQLIHHFDTQFLRLRHPLPKDEGVEIIQAINEEIPAYYKFDPQDFEKRFTIWEKQTALALKKSGCPHLVTSDMDTVELVKLMLDFWV